MKFRKKPVIIEAESYKQGLEDGVDTLIVGTIPDKNLMGIVDEIYGDVAQDPSTQVQVPYIQTLEGKHYIRPTDMIITGVKGERYPCKKDIFDMTYERVE